jgi:hypothetical protein
LIQGGVQGVREGVPGTVGVNRKARTGIPYPHARTPPTTWYPRFPYRVGIPIGVYTGRGLPAQAAFISVLLLVLGDTGRGGYIQGVPPPGAPACTPCTTGTPTLGINPWSTDTGRSDGINKYPCTGRGEYPYGGGKYPLYRFILSTILTSTPGNSPVCQLPV